MLRPKKNASTSLTKAIPLSECLAKTISNDSGNKLPGVNVYTHCRIVGEVANALIVRLPQWLSNALFPTCSELIAAVHDLGKVCPTFQEKIHRAINGYEQNSLPGLEQTDPNMEKMWGGHPGVSLASVKVLPVDSNIPNIIGQHHGYSPNIGARLSQDAVFGGKAWQDRREELIALLQTEMNCEWPTVKSPTQARLIAGLTTVADWIGSGSLFDNPRQPWQPLIEQAVDLAGFVRPEIQKDLSFNDIFGFSPYEAQQSLIDICDQPGVYILEAPMGLGKTEAALYAAYKAMSTGAATGIYFALPTQLTSEKIHERVTEFLTKILAPTCPNRDVLLLHSNAWLKQDMGADGQPGGSWFQSGKRGILAPFAVGTIDQALMAVMNVKHGFVRTFGLAGKVVILDEVHSYDAYTGTIMDKLVTALRELHCTVIILSATLTKQRREEFLRLPPNNNGYPLVSAVSKDGGLQEIDIASMANAKVRLQFHHESRQVIEEALSRAEQGQQVLWIENTVAEAQEQFGLISARAKNMSIPCGLLHSRFIKCDRRTNEDNWVALYGKRDDDVRRQKGRILIGTQVVEQSLDIDADFLVSRMCPTDMLLQRIGRLWRHVDTVRPAQAKRETWILTPQLNKAEKNPEGAFGNTAKIYSPYVLCRSLEVWHDLKTINLPSEIRELIEDTYSDREEILPMKKYLHDLEEKRMRLNRLALVGLSHGGQTLPENKATTRFSDQETVDVLLIKSLTKDNSKVTFLNGSEVILPKNIKATGRQHWRNTAAKLMQNTVRVAEYMAPISVSINSLSWLKPYLYLGNREQEESILRIAIVKDSDELAGFDGGQISHDYHLEYNNLIGYQAKKIK